MASCFEETRDAQRDPGVWQTACLSVYSSQEQVPEFQFQTQDLLACPVYELNFSAGCPFLRETLFLPLESHRLTPAGSVDWGLAAASLFKIWMWGIKTVFAAGTNWQLFISSRGWRRRGGWRRKRGCKLLSWLDTFEQRRARRVCTLWAGYLSY